MRSYCACLVLGAVVMLLPAKVWAQEAQHVATLQLASPVKPDSLDVSPDGEYAVVITRDIRIEGDPPQMTGIDTVLYLFETKTGKPVELPPALRSGGDTAWSSMGFSANGQWLCLRKSQGPMGPGRQTSVWLYNTETGSARQIEAPARGPARWVGNRYFFSSLGPRGVEPLKAYDPAKDTTAELPIRGFAAGATSDGKQLLVAGHPEDLSKNLAPRQMQTGAAVHVANLEGEILKTVCKASELSSAPTLSPDGKYVAFQSGPQGPPKGRPDPKDYSIKLIRVDDGKGFSLSGMYSPVGVTDEGLVCATRPVRGQEGSPLLSLEPSTGKVRTLAEKTIRATAQAGTVYFVQAVDNQQSKFALKSVEIQAR